MTSATTTSTDRRVPARFAAAGLLALAMVLGGCGATGEVQELVADARTQAEAVEGEIKSLGDQVPTLPEDVRAEVENAVASAGAATVEARDAIDKAAVDDDAAKTALADAEVALDAASAELRHVADRAAEAGSSTVSASLQELREQIDALRGEARRAAA